jgi:hypothetical protein
VIAGISADDEHLARASGGHVQEPVLLGLWFVGFVPTLGGQLREGSIAATKVAAGVAAARSAGSALTPPPVPVG